MPELSIDLAIYTLLALTCFILAALYLKEHNNSNSNKISSAENKSYQILSQAIKKAQALMTSSELEALKLTADSRFYKEKMEQKLEVEIEKLIGQYQASFANTQTEYSKYIAYLKAETDKSRNESMETIRERVNNLFSGFEEKLSLFLNETQKTSTQSIDLELKATRQLIETYKSNQLRIIDENIISMLERTLALVLAKKLTLKDQVDLVYQSLEQAKNEKFIV